jgi:4-amino-4-deoxy-L-arabinose transferase-like glycosyltransferase
MRLIESLAQRPWVRRAFPAALFVIAFLPRAIQPVSRPLVWYLRSAHFIDAVLAGDWGNTVYSEHPGVALMWPAAIGLKLYWALSGITPAAESVPPDFEPIHFFNPVPVAEIAAALLPLVLLISLSIVFAYFLLRRLFGGTIAAVATLLLAISPYYLVQSKILHPDAWMATLMLLSALTLLLYRRERLARWLILSAVFGGLALLTKPTALFLVPFSGLVLLVHASRITLSNRRSPASRFTFYALRSLLTRLFLPFVIWLLLAAVVYFALWPAMWVAPGDALAAVESGLVRHTSTAHDTPTFFLGQITYEDPGPVFYLVSMLFRTGEIELLFAGVAAVVGIVYLWRRRKLSHAGVDYLLLLAYVVFFLAQMSLGAKKMPRYVLPAILVLDVLAAAGIVAWARALAGRRRWLAWALMALPLLIQAVLVLPFHPYYGTTANWLAGGPQAAARAILTGEEGEGLAELATTLNARSEAESTTVAAQLKHVFSQYFRGTTLDIYERPADYFVFHRNYTGRDYKVEQWGELWERYAARAPEQEIVLGGVPYAWLYPELSPGASPEHALEVRMGDQRRFLGYDLRSVEAAPGDRVPLVLYWQSTEAVADDLSVFLHLLNGSGELVWQDDGAAAHGARPTWSWEAGEVIVDPHTLALPQDLPEGDYQLVAGLYDWQNGERLPAFAPAGERLAHDQIAVATFAVRRPGTYPMAWVARVLGGLVLLSALMTVRRRDE